MLVRPDGVIAWVPDAGLDLTVALATWMAL